MKAAIFFLVAAACFLCLFSDLVCAAPAPSDSDGKTFFDRIFDIPRSIFASTRQHLNSNGIKCPDGKPPVIDGDGKGTCHDNALNIAKSAVDSVNDFLNGKPHH